MKSWRVSLIVVYNHSLNLNVECLSPFGKGTQYAWVSASNIPPNPHQSQATLCCKCSALQQTLSAVQSWPARVYFPIPHTSLLLTLTDFVLQHDAEQQGVVRTPFPCTPPSGTSRRSWVRAKQSMTGSARLLLPLSLALPILYLLKDLSQLRQISLLLVWLL